MENMLCLLFVLFESLPWIKKNAYNKIQNYSNDPYIMYQLHEGVSRDKLRKGIISNYPQSLKKKKKCYLSVISEASHFRAVHDGCCSKTRRRCNYCKKHMTTLHRSRISCGNTLTGNSVPDSLSSLWIILNISPKIKELSKFRALCYSIVI